jgi:hypothetical protein
MTPRQNDTAWHVRRLGCDSPHQAWFRKRRAIQRHLVDIRVSPAGDRVSCDTEGLRGGPPNACSIAYDAASESRFQRWCLASIPRSHWRTCSTKINGLGFGTPSGTAGPTKADPRISRRSASSFARSGSHTVQAMPA